MDRNLGVPSSVSKMISELTVRSAQTVHLSWIKISTISKQTETSFHLSLVTQEYHPCCLKWFLSLWNVWRKLWTYPAPKLTLSQKGLKWGNMTHVTKEFHRVASKTISEAMVCLVQTMDLPCINTNISPNGLKQDSTWPTSPRSYIGCVQNDFRAYGRFGANRAPILNQISTISKWTETSFHLSLVT
jgi:hypothetical protein